MYVYVYICDILKTIVSLWILYFFIHPSMNLFKIISQLLFYFKILTNKKDKIRLNIKG